MGEETKHEKRNGGKEWGTETETGKGRMIGEERC
jgi:hypothetical protein